MNAARSRIGARPPEPDAAAGPVVEFGAFALDRAAHELRRDGVPVELEPRAFALLLHLARHADRVVDKTELLEALWGDVEVFEASLTTAVSRLRRALGDHAAVVRTEYGRGYRFEPALAPGASPPVDEPLGAPPEDAPPSVEPPPGGIDRRLRGAGATGLEALVAEARDAATDAEARGAYAEAVQRHEETLALLSLTADVDPQERLRLLIALARAEWRAGMLQKSRATAQQASRLALDVGDPRGAAEAALSSGLLLASQGAHEGDYLRMLEEAVAALPPGLDDGLRARLLAHAAWARAYSRQPGDERAAQRRAALALARACGDRHALVRTLCDVRAACTDPEESAERVRLDEEIVALAAAVGDRAALGFGHFHRGWDVAEAGDFPAADRDLAVHAAIAAERNDPIGRWRHALWRGMRALMAGRWTDAAQLAREAFALGSELDPGIAALSYATQGFTRQVMLGETAGLDVQIQSLLGQMPLLQLPRGALAFVLMRQGRLPDAEQVAEQVIALGANRLFHDPTMLPTLTFVAMVFAEVGNHRRCAEVYDVLLPFRGQAAMLGSNTSVYYGPVARPLAALAESLGRWGEADTHRAAALAACERDGARPWLAELRWDAARALRRRGGREARSRAEALAVLAREDAQALGIDDLLQRLAALG